MKNKMISEKTDTISSSVTQTIVQDKKVSLDDSKNNNQPGFKTEIVWFNVFIFATTNLLSLYGAYQFIFFRLPWTSFLYTLVLGQLSGLGITAGAHRLWAHKSYKAKTPMKIFLAMCNLIAYQNSIYEWARDHRVHHRFTDTNADPHNINRGFFFSHMGWLMTKKHPDVKEYGKLVDMSDIENDPIVMFQHKYYFYLMPIFAFLLPALIPIYFCGTDPWFAFRLYSLTRWTLTLHGTWCVNSAAHMFGYKPYDKFISPTQNIWVSFIVMGEGWHNYHHTFPWDYKASEYPYFFNISTAFIDACAWFGLAYDLKTAKQDLIDRRAQLTGSNSKTFTPSHTASETTEIWGWDDNALTKEVREMATIRYREKC